LNADPPPLGLYVHWPYCSRICPYCDFNVVRDRARKHEAATLVDAIITDIGAHAAVVGARRLQSIFFGGGTPSLMLPDDVGRLIEAARRGWEAAADLEVTLEANPTDAESGRFAALAAVGVNRLSLGVQSLDDGELKFLGRNHDAATARRAIGQAISCFPRVSIDLIYALPRQTPAGWEAALAEVARLGAEHLSPYQLTIEANTAFERAVRRGVFTPPTDDLGATFYDVTQTVLSEHGFEAYEVSNHARGPAARSRHNLIYWRGEDYVGVGPGAHGRLTLADGRYATEAPRGVAAYTAQVERTGRGARPSPLAPRERALELLEYTGLRRKALETALLIDDACKARRDVPLAATRYAAHA